MQVSGLLSEDRMKVDKSLIASMKFSYLIMNKLQSRALAVSVLGDLCQQSI